MRSRDLPASRTWRMARPEGITADPRADHVVLDVPACRAAGLDHRVVLDATPADLEGWFDVWRAAHAGKGLPAAFVSWETRDEAVPAAPPGVALRRLRCLMSDAPVDPEERHGVRPLDDFDAALELQFRAAGDGSLRFRDWLGWYWAGLRDRVAAGEGTVLAHYDGDALIGTAGVFWGAGREARLAAVATAPERRGQGVAGGLVREAVAAYQAESMGIVYAVCDEESAAERVYRRLGFRRVTSFWLASRPAG